MFFKKSDPTDKRVHKRLKARLLVKYHLKDGMSENVVTNLKNISVGGVSFATGISVTKNSFLELEILFLPEGYLLKTKGKVVWVNLIARSKQYLLGIEFEGLSEQDKELLNRYINEALKFNSKKNFK
ncbi:MAG: PilZ domain-containing protein [Candidatus Omnitrophica bacterium]|nr:PilZ domain-containing protein [Candidatus Omnitrophota bacterium]